MEAVKEGTGEFPSHLVPTSKDGLNRWINIEIRAMCENEKEFHRDWWLDADLTVDITLEPKLVQGLGKCDPTFGAVKIKLFNKQRVVFKITVLIQRSNCASSYIYSVTSRITSPF
jgi:hypothetical protein